MVLVLQPVYSTLVVLMLLTFFVADLVVAVPVTPVQVTVPASVTNTWLPSASAVYFVCSAPVSNEAAEATALRARTATAARPSTLRERIILSPCRPRTRCKSRQG